MKSLREESGGKDNPWDPKSSLLSRARFVNSWDCEVDKYSCVPTQKETQTKEIVRVVNVHIIHHDVYVHV